MWKMLKSVLPFRVSHSFISAEIYDGGWSRGRINRERQLNDISLMKRREKFDRMNKKDWLNGQARFLQR